MRRSALFALLAALLGAPACGSLGSRTVSPDRAAYSNAISSSWSEQMVLNLAKMRYGDVPVFLDVSSVIASYTFEGRVGGGIEWDTLGADSESASVGSTYQDRPTITYVPLTGEKFTRALLTPIPPATVFSMIQAGWPAGGVLPVCVRSLNGVRNQSLAMNPCPADAAWTGLVESWSAVQSSGAIDVRVQKTDGGESMVIVIGALDDVAVMAHVRRIRDALRAPPETRKFSIVFGALPAEPGEIAVISRSMFEVLLEIAAAIDVPDVDVAEGRASARPPEGSDALVHIRCSDSAPDGAATRVRYRGRWFWIADNDIRSKTRMMFLFFVQAMLESGGRGGMAPMLTISN